MLYPLIFRPIFKERVWGGRSLERLYGKPLPPGATIGESWEMSDRPGDTSVIANGPLEGNDLHWLMEQHATELLGGAKAQQGRFPLLIKLLDCRDTLSLQVHPPAAKAAQLKGEPKTEMWFVAHALPGAELYVGLKNGVTASEFRQKVRTGAVAECFHRIPVKAGDAMFLPSGRVHALGSGLVIFEIQQNSDTTYRVFDWNRVGLDGKPRPLHIAESLESIDFADFEPGLSNEPWSEARGFATRSLVRDPLFNVDLLRASATHTHRPAEGTVSVFGVVKGSAQVTTSDTSVALEPGQFCLLPASVRGCEIIMEAGTALLRAQPGRA
jgi:mannose-6-phosphate isomerase